ncbi:ankyrin repeat-containing protein ITN1-like [Vitis riparia]|uniref:ankyrin repeat-containing protein ITN1-like n=1 Tax=Vitis riparia TaxID=96939 RepID=UPI00155A3049|nr:ankyrin repeat-containing protein ITN1-like [Vitis riparia]
MVDNLCPSTPILIAASNGIVEMVEKTLQDLPLTFHDRDFKRKNIVILAVENRQSHLYDFLLKSSHLHDEDLALHAVDEDENSPLHLAAELKNYESWLIPSSTLPMHWEYVKKSLRPNVSASSNRIQKTPDQIFTETHKQPLEKSKEWLNSTCNSCSFTAALIATVAFASSATVPGGVDQDTGKPIFQHHLAFRFFVISSLVALCSSFISLLVFFALLTSKCQYKDFSKNVPRNLLFGLTSLFISMAAMLICFISGHLLMLDNQLKYYAAVPMYAVTLLVITFISLQQLPSFFALVRAKFHNVPERIYKEDPL